MTTPITLVATGRGRALPGGWWRAALLALAVGVAFADSSIVVIALPEMMGAFDTTIPAVSWVITAYNLAVAVVALAVMGRLHLLSAAWLTRAGLAVFAAACLVCSVAPGLGVLVAGRAAQGVGGAMLLAGAVPLLAAVAGASPAGARIWGGAAVVGAAVGPALGGLLTQVFDWRSIFIAQVPVALAALAATGASVDAGARVRHASATGGDTRTARMAAGAALALVSAALVGALFLASVLVIDGWGHAPLFAALVVSALPAGAVIAGPVARRSDPPVAIAGGIAIVAGSLVAMGLVRADSPGALALALLLCGVGLGLCMPPLTRISLQGPDAASAGSWSVGVRHLGLVVGLVIMAPLLASSLSAVTDRAELVGAAYLLDAPISIEDKIAIGVALEEALRDTPNGSAPDLRAAVAAGGDPDEPARAALGDRLDDLVAPAVTRGFRSSFLLCALLGILALLPAWPLRRPRP